MDFELRHRRFAHVCVSRLDVPRPRRSGLLQRMPGRCGLGGAILRSSHPSGQRPFEAGALRTGCTVRVISSCDDFIKSGGESQELGSNLQMR